MASLVVTRRHRRETLAWVHEGHGGGALGRIHAVVLCEGGSHRRVHAVVRCHRNARKRVVLVEGDWPDIVRLLGRRRRVHALVWCHGDASKRIALIKEGARPELVSLMSRRRVHARRYGTVGRQESLVDRRRM